MPAATTLQKLDVQQTSVTRKQLEKRRCRRASYPPRVNFLRVVDMTHILLRGVL